jgi:hypothetical protein
MKSPNGLRLSLKKAAHVAVGGCRVAGKVGMGQESKTSGAKDDYIAFTPGINPRPTLRPEFFRSL